MALRVILTTGGTGGHIFPALAVAEALKKRLPDVYIIFVGGLYGPEKQLVEKAGLEFYGLPVRGMLGRGFKAIPALWAMARGLVQAFRRLHEWKPDAVMGFGGYAAFATVCAAWMRGRPTGIHEQNAIPGAANKILGKMVRRICLSWPNNSYFPAQRSVLTGNPIRQDIAAVGGHDDNGDPLAVSNPDAIKAISRKTRTSAPRLLIMGGSQGAKAINSLAVTMLSQLRNAGVHILHQTGPADLDRTREAYKSHGYSQEDVNEMVVPFIYDMASAYAQADLALCRAGATTLSELAATGTPALLIPFPYAAHDHQTGNARAMASTGLDLSPDGGALLVPENEIYERDMAALLLSLLQDHPRLDAMSAAARTLARPDAASAVADEIIKLAALR